MNFVDLSNNESNQAKLQSKKKKIQLIISNSFNILNV